ncbi:c-type cytochrome [Moritella sp. 24]|uniref:c-type cytochrome n=1 Tax=Moritella sp. 24 TaxID=2746230 RepID=UPI001BA70334|nr:c-type cytochrome [Moritella sp. 24]QUM76696.1 c-type cytochrome [Moritella sp. 24]
MNKHHLLLITSLSISASISTSVLADNAIPDAPAWSTPARGVAVESTLEPAKMHTLEGSKVSYTQAEIDNKFSAPDWFPEQHDPMPEIVQFGKKPKVWACASCHLASGSGHPESSTLAGLSASYMTAQLKAFASGERIDYSGHMNRMAALMTEAEMLAASTWFASLSPQQFIAVKEVKSVPITYVDSTRMRQIDTSKKVEEPIGNRIIEVPLDKELVHKRAPLSEFISYVPEGSIERGQNLVQTGGGKTIPCMSCHGADLSGSQIGPAIAGNFGIYTVRQLHGFKSNTRNGAQSAMMKPVVANLSDKDIIDIAAYLSTVSIKR